MLAITILRQQFRFALQVAIMRKSAPCKVSLRLFYSLDSVRCPCGSAPHSALKRHPPQGTSGNMSSCATRIVRVQAPIQSSVRRFSNDDSTPTNKYGAGGGKSSSVETRKRRTRYRYRPTILWRSRSKGNGYARLPPPQFYQTDAAGMNYRREWKPHGL